MLFICDLIRKRKYILYVASDEAVFHIKRTAKELFINMFYSRKILYHQHLNLHVLRFR